MKKELIITHKNCMDGLASAFILDTVFDKVGNGCEVLFLQYGDNFEELLFDAYDLKNYSIIMADFSLSLEDMKRVAASCEFLTVLDHHKTAQKTLDGFGGENIEVTFDMNRSGALITYDWAKEYCKENDEDFSLKREFFEYVSDRDLWEFALNSSKEINEFIAFNTKQNDIESFASTYFNYFDERFTFINNGNLLLQKTEKSVIKKADKVSKLKEIMLNGKKFLCLNATENISEIGNYICLNHDVMAAMYFITNDNKVIFSLRSIDSLDDASEVAKAFGGGGHRNACGFETTLDGLSKHLNNTPLKYESDLKTIMDLWDVVQLSPWNVFIKETTDEIEKYFKVYGINKTLDFIKRIDINAHHEQEASCDNL